MSKRGENIYKRKDGRWEGRYIKCRTLHGKIQYGYVYGKSYSEVKCRMCVSAVKPKCPIRMPANKTNVTHKETPNIFILPRYTPAATTNA